MGRPGGPAKHPPSSYSRGAPGCGQSFFGTMLLMLVLGVMGWRHRG